MSALAPIYIPKPRRALSILPNQHDDSDGGGVFKLTQRVVREPRRLRRRQMVDAWKKSSLSRGLAEPSLASTIQTMKTPRQDGHHQFKWELSSNQLDPKPVQILSPSKTQRIHKRASAWSKYTDSHLLAHSSRAIVDKLCGPCPSTTAKPPNRKRRIMKRFRLARVQPLPLSQHHKDDDTISSVSSSFRTDSSCSSYLSGGSSSGTSTGRTKPSTLARENMVD